MLTIAGFITYMKGLKPKSKIGAAFGFCGRSGESVKTLNGVLTEIKALKLFMNE